MALRDGLNIFSSLPLCERQVGTESFVRLKSVMTAPKGRSGNLGRVKPLSFTEAKWVNLQLSRFTWTFKWNEQIHVISSSFFTRGISHPLYFSGVKAVIGRWIGEQEHPSWLFFWWCFLVFFFFHLNGSSENDVLMI